MPVHLGDICQSRWSRHRPAKSERHLPPGIGCHHRNERPDQGKNRTRAGRQSDTGRNRQAVECAEPFSGRSPGMMQANGKRPCHPMFKRSSCHRHDPAIRGERHLPDVRIPGEPLRLSQLAWLAGLDRTDIVGIVDKGEMSVARRDWLSQHNAANRRLDQRVRDPLRLLGGVEFIAAAYITGPVEEVQHFSTGLRLTLLTASPNPRSHQSSMAESTTVAVIS